MRTDANTCPVRLYEKVRFDPLYGINLRGLNDGGTYDVIGKVTYINNDHHWFLTEYKSKNGLKQSISFTFSDVGDRVFKI